MQYSTVYSWYTNVILMLSILSVLHRYTQRNTLVYSQLFAWWKFGFFSPKSVLRIWWFSHLWTLSWENCAFSSKWNRLWRLKASFAIKGLTLDGVWPSISTSTCGIEYGITLPVIPGGLLSRSTLVVQEEYILDIVFLAFWYLQRRSESGLLNPQAALRVAAPVGQPSPPTHPLLPDPLVHSSLLHRPCYPLPQSSHMCHLSQRCSPAVQLTVIGAVPSMAPPPALSALATQPSSSSQDVLAAVYQVRGIALSSNVHVINYMYNIQGCYSHMIDSSLLTQQGASFLHQVHVHTSTNHNKPSPTLTHHAWTCFMHLQIHCLVCCLFSSTLLNVIVCKGLPNRLYLILHRHVHPLFYPPFSLLSSFSCFPLFPLPPFFHSLSFFPFRLLLSCTLTELMVNIVLVVCCQTFSPMLW